MPYTAVVLSEESRSAVVQWVVDNHGIPEGWVVKGHHCTIDLKPAAKSMGAAFVGQTVELKAVRFGVASGILAIEVETVVPSKNERKHVTICHHPEVKPKASNEIEVWNEIESFVLVGVVEEVL